MSRKSRRPATGIQLFPFLAVLICTMGALIVLLVLMVQHTNVDAKTKAAALLAEQQEKSADDQERIRREREKFEDEQWRAEMLAQQREETAEELTQRRLKLSHLEDHIRRLRQQAQDLIERAQEIDDGKNDDNLAATRAQLDALRRQIADKQRELEEARKQKPKDQWFALVAYDGPNGTRRRPIYLECTDRGVVLQPEGLVFNPDDFSGPLTAGNPLDSALRATREYLVKAGAQAHGEPYPLLVVRPSGIVAYSAARAAMKSWDQEFGYELVAEDTQLTFGSPDPALQQLLGQTVAVARQKQALMMAAMPRHYEKGESLTSFAPQDQPEYRQAVASAGGRGFGGGSGGDGFGAGGNMPVNPRGGFSGGRGGDMPVRGNLPGGDGDSLEMAGSGGSGIAGAVGGGQGYGSGTGTGTAGGNTGGTGGGPSLGNPSGGTAAGGGSAAGGSAGGSSAPGGASGMSGGANSISMGNPAATAASAGGAAGQDNGASGGNGSGRNPGQPGASPPATGQAQGGTSATKGGTAKSGSTQRGSSSASGGSGGGKGSNWGLPESRIHSTAVTRPIRVVVLRDRIIILPEQGDDRPAQTIRISQQLTFAEVDRFVVGVQKHMQSWGIAVSNGYWKPILRIEVAPDAEDVFADLQLGIEDSGFDVQRKVE